MKRARLHSAGPRVYYVCYVNEDNRLVGPFRTKKAAQAAVDRANSIETGVRGRKK